MKRALSILAIFALALSAQQPAPQPKVPRKAGDIGIQVAQEKYLWLSEYSGKTVIMAFILTTCPHCQYTTGILNKIQKEYAGKGVQVIESAIEPMSSLHIPDFKKQFQTEFPVGYNEQSYVAKFLGYPENDPMFVPQIVFVDRTGTIRAQLTGESPEMAKDTQEKGLREVLERTIKEGGK
jgi:thiol-disulfide isomerase/thioredoxin